MKKWILSSLFILLSNQVAVSQQPNWNDEIIYHVMPRSFYDSNGDLHGDLNGFVEKLDYLQTLGVTAILFTPLYESGFYHNYFPTDYEKIDPEYGTMQDYIHFVEEVHRRKMKFFMDMETQYVQSGHRWFDTSYQNPDSPSDFVYYSDAENRYPEQIFRPPGSELYDFMAWPDQSFNIATLDLNNPDVKDWMIDFYTYWVDPNKDGKFNDGVDGFRIDHIMDDLDNKGLFTNLYENFWQPVFRRCREINSDIFIFAEQADWTEYGSDIVLQSGADAAFSFPLRFAIVGKEVSSSMFSEEINTGGVLNPALIYEIVETTLEQFPKGAYTINFIENHDTERWASIVQNHDGKLQAAAVLNLLLPGIPSIYYGQELGVTGTVGKWGYDVNHLPVREAFPWTPDPDTPGTAVFYKETGPWWDQSYYLDGGSARFALSVQEQDPRSLWNHYRNLIALRKEHAAFRQGDYQSVRVNNPNLMIFSRTLHEETLLVVLNLANEWTTFDLSDMAAQNWEKVYGNTTKSGISFHLEAYDFLVFKRQSGPSGP